MVVAQGDVWWADLPQPIGSEPGYRRPVVVVQGDAFNRGGLSTAICVSLTGNLRWANVPGNLFLPANVTGLPRDSVANISQVMTVDLSRLTDQVTTLPRSYLESILTGFDVILGRR